VNRTSEAEGLMKFDEYELASLRPLAERYPNADAAAAEVARLSAVLTLPKGTVHIISDIHGEDQKLRHVVNNASGTLRPLVERLLGPTISPDELRHFLTLTFYPAEVCDRLTRSMTEVAEVRAFAAKTLGRQFVLARALAGQYSLRRAMRLVPSTYRDLIAEMLHAPTTERGVAFFDAIVAGLAERGRAFDLVHVVGRLVRNLAIEELVIAGDCWDRGPRGDRVVDYLRQQPNVSFIWGNHDAAWIGAALGCEALICTVLRVSLRYRRLAQLDDGYGIPLMPLEHLARTAYADDPAPQFMPKSSGLRPAELVARMHKAVAVMQFKLEGQKIARHPEWGLDHRRLLHRIDRATNTIEVDGHRYELHDATFPTVDPADPYTLTPGERTCLDTLRNSFVYNQKLRDHVGFLVNQGTMSLVRDGHLIFHGCVSADARGNFLPMHVNGQELTGRALFCAVEDAVRHTVERPDQDGLDLLWYLWCGPRSPLFGKDRIATLERDFVADPHVHHEEKDAYFKLVHEAWFCDKVLKEFGVDSERGLIVNGHVPVKIDKGESPLKRSGKAITIDGAFSEAYGDHGFTLVIESDQTLLARHHHFESVEAAIRDGVDIVPAVSVVREWETPRRVSDTERGATVHAEIALLTRLVDAYNANALRPDRRGGTRAGARPPQQSSDEMAGG